MFWRLIYVVQYENFLVDKLGFTVLKAGIGPKVVILQFLVLSLNYEDFVVCRVHMTESF